jgi:hypothetical protein
MSRYYELGRMCRDFNCGEFAIIRREGPRVQPVDLFWQKLSKKEWPDPGLPFFTFLEPKTL